MLKVDRSVISRGQDRKTVDFTARPKSRSSRPERKLSDDADLDDDERDESGKFKNWPVAGIGCD